MSEPKCECRIHYGTGKGGNRIVKCAPCKAAPDLLEACKEMLENLCVGMAYSEDGRHAAIANLEAIIGKASFRRRPAYSDRDKKCQP